MPPCKKSKSQPVTEDVGPAVKCFNEEGGIEDDPEQAYALWATAVVSEPSEDSIAQDEVDDDVEAAIRADIEPPARDTLMERFLYQVVEDEKDEHESAQYN